VKLDDSSPNKSLHPTAKAVKHIALGVNIGNLSRGRRAREPMLARCQRINRSLAEKRVDLRVIGFFRHTGNLVLCTATLDAAQAAATLSHADGATWMAVAENAMRAEVHGARPDAVPGGEYDVRGDGRWTHHLVPPYGRANIRSVP